MRRLRFAAVALLALAGPAGATFSWEASGGWNFGGSGFGDLKQPATPPAVATSVGNFTNGGALCPGPGTPNFLCGFYAGKSEVAGGLVKLHATARLQRKNATSDGGSKIVYAGARVWFIGLKNSSVATPASFVKFDFGLHGTRTETASVAGVTVQAKGTAFLVADTQRFVQCFADVCAPIVVPVSSDWNPNAPNGTAMYLDLRADVAIGAPSGLVFDAEAIADYGDTLELLAAELQDANGDPIPGASLVVSDGAGGVAYTIPSTPPPPTTTTLAGTTTTTATITTTTTVAGPTTTTTTLPASCAEGASFASLRCRLGALLGSVQGTAAGPVAVKLATRVGAAQEAVTTAEQLVTDARKQATKRLAKASRALAQYARILRTRAAGRALDDATRAALAAPVAQLRADLKALRAGS